MQATEARKAQAPTLAYEQALVLGLQGTVGNHAVSRLVRQHGHERSRWLASVQRAPVPGAAPKDSLNDYVDLINGFQELAATAMNEGGKHLDTVRLGSDLTPAHRRLLESVRGVLIQAQESAESKRAAVTQWPTLEARFREAMDHASKLRMKPSVLANVDNILNLVSEKYIHVPHRGPARAESPEDYVDLVTGVEQLLKGVTSEWWDMTSGVVPLNFQEVNSRQRKALGAIKFGGHLTPKHHDLLESLRTAFILARTGSPGSAAQALKLWKSLQQDVGIAFERAPAYVTAADLPGIQKELKQVGEQLIGGSAYTEIHSQAKEKVDLKAPDLVFQEEKFKEAAEDLETVKKLAEKATDMTKENVFNQALERAGVAGEMGKAIMELAKAPHEIHERLEEFKKRDLIGKSVSVADLADKILGIRNAFVKVSCTVIRSFASGMVAKAAEETVIKRWAHIAEWAGEKLEVLEKVEKVAGVISIAVSAIKVLDAIREGKWGKAFTEAATTGAGYLAGVAVKGSAAATGEGSAGLAMGGAGMVAASVVVVAALIEGLNGAAAMLRYCKKANIREAAMTFVDQCVDAANIGAKDFIADVALLSDPSAADQKNLIMADINSYVKYWQRDLLNMNKQVNDTRVIRMGGQPDLRDALGPEALQVLQTAGAAASYQQMADQIRIIFEGANKMTEYVVKNYPREEKTEGKEGGEE
jgi:hypothetical protein